VALSGSLCAQTAKTITIRMMDSKTGHLLKATNYQVRIDHEKAVHVDWASPNEDGTAELKLPPAAALLSLHGTFDSAMQVYVNCDTVKDKDLPTEHWYEVPTILTYGLVAPSGCGNSSLVKKQKEKLKPGEFVFFVRKSNWREQLQDYRSN
jgi:hypothetical protein